MTEMMWLALAYSRLGIENEILRNENTTLRQENEQLKAAAKEPEPLKVVPPPEEKEHA